MNSWNAGDVEALLPALRSYARALARDPTVADDLVQDALVRAYERASTYRAGLPLKAWLLAILHRLFVDAKRRQAAEQRRDTSIELLSLGEAQPGEQEQTVFLREVAARFDALPVEQRAVLHLIGVEGLTYHEASLALDTPIGTIMSRLSRARAALRKAEMVAPDAVRLQIVRGNDAS